MKVNGKSCRQIIEKAAIHLTELRQKLLDRKNGLIKKEKAPTLTSIKNQCKKILSREYLKDIVAYTITLNEDLPQLDFSIFQKIRNLHVWTNLSHFLLFNVVSENDSYVTSFIN